MNRVYIVHDRTFVNDGFGIGERQVVYADLISAQEHCQAIVNQHSDVSNIKQNGTVWSFSDSKVLCYIETKLCYDG